VQQRELDDAIAALDGELAMAAEEVHLLVDAMDYPA
jgi:hypothetical protein